MKRTTDFTELLTEKYNLSTADAERFVQMMTDVLNDALHYEKQVKIKGLGTFKVIPVNARESVDVNTGQRITIDARDKISFVPEATLKERVNSPFEQFSSVELADGVDFSPIDKKYEGKPEEVSQHVPEPVVVEKKPVVVEEKPVVVEEKPVEKEPESVEPEPSTPEPQPVEAVMTPEPQPVETVMTPEPQPMEAALTPEPPTPAEPEVPSEPDAPSADDDQEDTEEEASNWKEHVAFFLTVIVLGVLVGAGIFYFLESKRQQRQQTLEMLSIRAQEGPVSPDTANTNAELINNQVKQAEQKEQAATKAAQTAKPETKPTEPKPAAKPVAKPAAPQPEAVESSKYDSDPRIRTGAYRIVGIEKTVTVRAGQTLSSISRSQLGPGMECYVEAVNPKGELKEGQKVKIPKLQLKKRSKTKN